MNQQAKPSDGSFVKMSSLKIIDMANATLKWIKESREEAVQDLVDREKDRIINGFWHRFFKKPTPSDKEVLDNINGYGCGDSFYIPETFFINLRYSKNEETAYRLLNATKHADEIYISTKDLQRLCIYIP